MKKVLKKIFVLLLAFVALSSSLPTLFVPQRAHAIVTLSSEVNPVIIGNTVKTAIESTKTAVESTVTATVVSASLSQQLLEWAQSFVVSTLKRRILDVMVDQVVTWVQGGGEPKFITDWESFLGDIGQGAVGEFVNQIGAGFLCSPFSLQVRIGLLPVKRFANNSPYACTLDQIVQNVQGFYDDFRNGGWIAYNANWQPQNNYYGALLIAWDARNNYVADKLAAAANNALANKGFLGTKRCYDTATGQEVSESAATGRESLVGGGSGSTRDFTTGGDVNGSFRTATHTVRCEDTTPGGIASAAIEKAVGSDFDFIINAQQLGDYAAAIVNALTNRLITEGVNGLRGVHQGGGGTYQPSRNAGTTYGGFQSVNNIPGGTRGAISSYAGTSAGGVSALSRSQLITRLNSALARRNSANDKFSGALALAQSYVAITDDTLACHSTVPALRSGAIHDAILQKNTDANSNLDLVTSPMQNNLDAVDELTQTITQITGLTDAQFTARVNEFQVVFINSEPTIVNAETGQASSLLQQMQTLVTPSVIQDAQRDVDYCISQGGIVGDLTNGVAAVQRISQSIFSGRTFQFIGRTFVSTDGTERVIKRIVRNSSNPLGSTIFFNTKAPGETVAHEERMTLLQLQTLAQAGGLRMLQ